MRFRALPMLLAMTAWTACTARTRPYRFASPMLGTAEVPAQALPGAPPRPPPELANRTANRIRVVSAPAIREASAASAAAVVAQPNAKPERRAQLPAPNTLPVEAALPLVRSAADLRALVGRRDNRRSIVAAMTWARDLGALVEAATGSELLAWAERTHHLAMPREPAGSGDLLVFDHVDSDDEADLVAIVIGRDARGVTELIYLDGGVIRRGFADPARPSMRRDADGRVVNTFMRHGKRWPPKGTHYLAGELLSHVVRAR